MGEGEHLPAFRAGSGSGGSAAGRQSRSSTYPPALCFVHLPRRAIAIPRLNRQGLAPVTTKSTRRLPHWAAHQPLVPVRDGQIGAVALGHRGRVGLDLLPSVAGGIGAKRLRGSMCTGEPPTKAPKEV